MSIAESLAVSHYDRARDQYSNAGIGFLADARRQNVALTRAKRALWVLGRADTLQCSEPWAAFISHCREQGRVIPVLGSHDDLLRTSPVLEGEK